MQALVNEVSRAWDAYKAERKGAEARARALIEAEVAKAIASKRSKVSEALRVALEGGATKVALKAVTTKDRRSFDSFVPLPKAPDVPAAVGDHVAYEWAGELVRITLDPSAVVDPAFDPGDPRCWACEFEIYTRPTDGKEFLDPVQGREYPVGYGVSDWLYAHPAETKVILEWAKANPA